MSTMDQWTAAVCTDLGLDPSDADLRAVLDLTRDVAHSVARPAAPLTAYLVGVAVGRGLALPDAAGRISALAAGWDGEDLSLTNPAHALAGPSRPAAGAPRLPDSYKFRHRPAAGRRPPLRRCPGGGRRRAKGGQ